jgi:hypothetical protein
MREGRANHGGRPPLTEKRDSSFEDDVTLEIDAPPGSDGVDEVWEWDGDTWRRVE